MPRPFLLPLVPFYWAAIKLRNWAYDLGLAPTHVASVPVISIGNLEAGGTGKTPHVELFLRLISPTIEVAVLSRGYGRNTSGYREVQLNDSAQEVGDEPAQIKRNFPHITVAVCEDRTVGVASLKADHGNVQLVILDDAYQHRAINRDLNVVITRHDQPFWKGMMLPAGNLREPISAIDRADVLIVSGGHGPITLPDCVLHNFRGLMLRSEIKTTGPWQVDGSPFNFTDVIVLSGIAAPDRFARGVDALQLNTRATHIFSDHHAYTNHDLQPILDQMDSFGPQCGLITTQKDLSRLLDHPFYQQLSPRLGLLTVASTLGDQDAETLLKTISKKCLNR